MQIKCDISTKKFIIKVADKNIRNWALGFISLCKIHRPANIGTTTTYPPSTVSDQVCSSLAAPRLRAKSEGDVGNTPPPIRNVFFGIRRHVHQE